MELARDIARSPSEKDVLAASGRVQFWTERRALRPIGDKDVGRGRERRYAADELFWCRLFFAMADLGLGIDRMRNVRGKLEYAIRKLPQRAPAIKAAMRGEGAPLYFVSEGLPGEDGSDDDDGPDQGSAMWDIRFSPVDLGENFRAGWIINLTKGFRGKHNG